MPKIGAHTSAAFSLELSLDRAKKIGAECTQIFISPPQQWAYTHHGQDEIKRYRLKLEAGINPNFIHGTYLINLATEREDHLKKSVDWLKYAMKIAGELGVDGVIFHIGSHKGRGLDTTINQICNALSNILKEKNSKTMLILENSAGGGGSIGSKFSELGKIIKQVKDQNDRLKVCLDTCHAFAAGYDIKTPTGLKSTIEEFKQEIGLKNLVVVHANDSKFNIGSGKDRHENIGEGFIGREGFKNIINHPVFKDIPFILEVPGFSSTGTDIENIKLLKKLYFKNSP